MAIKLSLDFQGAQYPEAYLKINKIISTNNDLEFYENLPDGTQILRWKKNPHNVASIVVYSDKGARDNNVIPLDHRLFEFKYNIQGYDENIFEVAYREFKKSLEDNNIDCEDV